MLEYLTLRTVSHLALHFAVPLMVAAVFYRNQWQKAFLIMAATMLVDLDHLLADPIFDPNRCSIGFHPLHSEWAIGGYALALFIQPLRLVALGLVIHMLVDGTDCFVVFM